MCFIIIFFLLHVKLFEQIKYNKNTIEIQEINTRLSVFINQYKTEKKGREKHIDKLSGYYFTNLQTSIFI